MTLKEAMGYRGENADTLAEKIGIRAGEVRRWMGENGMLRISGARMQHAGCRTGRRGAGDGGRCGSGAVRERRQRMSKDKGRMSRKRISKKIAGRFGGQVPEVRDIVRKNLVDPLKRRQEKIVTAKHRAWKQEGKAV